MYISQLEWSLKHTRLISTVFFTALALCSQKYRHSAVPTCFSSCLSPSKTSSWHVCFVLNLLTYFTYTNWYRELMFLLYNKLFLWISLLDQNCSFSPLNLPTGMSQSVLLLLEPVCTGFLPLKSDWRKKVTQGLPWWSGSILRAPSAGVLGSIPGQGNRSHILQLRVHMPQLRISQAAVKVEDPTCHN